MGHWTYSPGMSRLERTLSFPTTTHQSSICISEPWALPTLRCLLDGILTAHPGPARRKGLPDIELKSVYLEPTPTWLSSGPRVPKEQAYDLRRQLSCRPQVISSWGRTSSGHPVMLQTVTKSCQHLITVFMWLPSNFLPTTSLKSFSYKLWLCYISP